LVSEGDAISVGQTIAKTPGIFGMFKAEYHSKVAGRVESISNVTGQLIVRGDPVPVDVLAYLSGEVVEVIPDQGVVIEAETDDISVDGVFVRTRRRPPDVGTKLGLLLTLEAPAPELMLKGIVAWVTNEPDAESGAPSQGMGIEFEDVDDETRDILARALRSTGGEIDGE